MSEIKQNNTYMKGFIPYALAAFLVGIVGGFTAVLAPAFVKDMGLAYNNTTWLSLALAMSTAACAPILASWVMCWAAEEPCFLVSVFSVQAMSLPQSQIPFFSCWLPVLSSVWVLPPLRR
jgi:hypothetical protein